MTQASEAILTGAAAPCRPLNADDAVRAALRHRRREVRSFGNEDDLEGPRPPPAEHAPSPTVA